MNVEVSSTQVADEIFNVPTFEQLQESLRRGDIVMEDADITSTLQKERDAEAPLSSSQSRSRSQQPSPQASLMEAAAMVLELHVDLPTTQGNINPALLQVVQSERDQPELLIRKIKKKRQMKSRKVLKYLLLTLKKSWYKTNKLRA